MLPGKERGNFPADHHFERAIRVPNPLEQAFPNFGRIVRGVEEKAAGLDALDHAGDAVHVVVSLDGATEGINLLPDFANRSDKLHHAQTEAKRDPILPQHRHTALAEKSGVARFVEETVNLVERRCGFSAHAASER